MLFITFDSEIFVLDVKWSISFQIEISCQGKNWGSHYKILKGTCGKQSSCNSTLLKEEVYTKNKILPVAENLQKVW